MNAAEIKALLDASTPGPWRWEVNLGSKIVALCGGNPGQGFGRYDLTVMGFARWGMSRAAPIFWNWPEKCIGDPKRADAIAVPVKDREHHERWFRDIDHPDARLIAAAPDLAALAIAQAAEIERLTNNRDMWKGQSERQARELERLRAMIRDTADEALRAEIPEAPRESFYPDEFNRGYDAAISRCRAILGEAP